MRRHHPLPRRERREQDPAPCGGSCENGGGGEGAGVAGGRILAGISYSEYTDEMRFNCDADCNTHVAMYTRRVCACVRVCY